MLRARWLLIASALAVVGGSVYLLALRNESRTITIAHSQHFWLEFGRGSGWHGLDTIKLDQTGRVVLHRMKSEPQQDVIVLSWEVATLQLPPDGVAEVLKAVESNGLMGLHKRYHNPHVADGTQWVLWIKQGDQEKSVYFDNRFPAAITLFADQMDAILARAGLEQVTWQPVPDRESRKHERELWDSIKR